MIKNKTGFTLIELLIVIAIIAILAASVIMLLSPGERVESAREATRESHMISIGNAIHLAVIDCASGSAAYCAKASDVVSTCRVAATWALDADATNCPLDNDFNPLDPLTSNPYLITNDGNHNVEVWADSSESTWHCNWVASPAACTGTSKRF